MSAGRGQGDCRRVQAIVYFVLLVVPTDSATHWVVTESGRIEVQADSPYSMRNPSDLVAFLEQEERARELKELHGLLLKNSHRLEKADLEKEDDKEVEMKFYKTNINCKKAPHRLAEMDLFTSTYLSMEKKGIRMEDHLKCKPNSHIITLPQVPDCRNPRLDFSPKVFEHLPGVQLRHQLPVQPEPALRKAFPEVLSDEDIGFCLRKALEANSTSWVLFNLAAIYWRIHGHYWQTSECLRRALHFSPTRHRDIALLSLANVLHRSDHSNDAVVLLLAAIDLSPNIFVHHYTLGNVHAVLRDWNKSAEAFAHAADLEVSSRKAQDTRHAVLCQQSLEEMLTNRQHLLEKTLRELEEYQEQHVRFQQVEHQLLRHMTTTRPDAVLASLAAQLPTTSTSTATATPPTTQKEQSGKTFNAPNGGKLKKASSRPQCPAGQSPKGKIEAEKSGEEEADVCSLNDAIHHGQSQLSDAPPPENNQCPLEDSEWGDTMQDARQELEKIIREIEQNSDPEAMREMRDRLKSISETIGLDPSVLLHDTDSEEEKTAITATTTTDVDTAGEAPNCGKKREESDMKDKKKKCNSGVAAEKKKKKKKKEKEGEEEKTNTNKKEDLVEKDAEVSKRDCSHQLPAHLKKTIIEVCPCIEELTCADRTALILAHSIGSAHVDYPDACYCDHGNVEARNEGKNCSDTNATSADGNGCHDDAAQEKEQLPQLVLNMASDEVSGSKVSGSHGSGLVGTAHSGNIHPPKLIQRVIDRTEIEVDEREVEKNEERLAPKRKGNLHPPRLSLPLANDQTKDHKEDVSSDEDLMLMGNATSQNPDERWAYQQSQIVRAAERLKQRGPAMPAHAAESVDWNKIYKQTPQNVVMLNRAKNEDITKVLERRRALVSKIKLLSLSWSNVSLSAEQVDEESGLPIFPVEVMEQEECEDHLSVPTWDRFPAVYLPPESRGVNVTELLAAGLPSGYLHPRPYKPPVCVKYAALPHSVLAFDHLLGIQYRDQLPVVPEPALKPVLAGLVDVEVPVEEVGQRILTAFEMSVQPAHWALFHLAGLFFRIAGNPFHAIECFRRAVHFAPCVARDVPLVSMAEVLHRTGQLSDAVVLLNAALEIHHQPETLFALGNAYSTRGQYGMARIHHACACHAVQRFELACEAAKLHACYEKRGIPRDDIDSEFRLEVIPTCTVEKCEETGSLLRTKFSVVTCEALALSSSELPEIVHSNSDMMKPHLEKLASSIIDDGVKRLQQEAEERQKIVTEVHRYMESVKDRFALINSKVPSQVEDQSNDSDQESVRMASASNPDLQEGQDSGVTASSPGLPIRVFNFEAPSSAECESINVNLKQLTSTWLSVEVKEINVADHLDLSPSSSENEKTRLPECVEAESHSAYMMDHLEGVQDRIRFEHVELSEPGLQQVLSGLGGAQALSLQFVANRISQGLEKNSTSWVLTNLAALVWRVTGRADQAIRCLRQALHFSPTSSRDVALVSLANVMARAQLFRDALVLMSMALEVSPHLVVNHFTVANILASTDSLAEAEFFFANTLRYQPSFQPAVNRLKAVQCRLLQRRREQAHAKDGNSRLKF